LARSRSTNNWVSPVEIYGSGSVAMVWCAKQHLLKSVPAIGGVVAPHAHRRAARAGGLIDCHQIVAMRRTLPVLDTMLPAPYRIITPFPPHGIKTGMLLMAHPGR